MEPGDLLEDLGLPLLGKTHADSIFMELRDLEDSKGVLRALVVGLDHPLRQVQEAGGAVQQWLVRKTEPGVLRREGYSGHRKGTRTRRRSGAYRQHFSFQLHEIPPQT